MELKQIITDNWPVIAGITILAGVIAFFEIKKHLKKKKSIKKQNNKKEEQAETDKTIEKIKSDTMELKNDNDKNSTFNFEKVYEEENEYQKSIVEKQQKQSEALFQSLLQKAFKGELVSAEALDEIS